MPGAAQGTFDSPDETRTPDKTTIQILKLSDTSIARVTFQPGWKWSECIKPIAGTESCQARHVGTVVGGRMHVTHEDGSEFEAGPGSAYVIEPGHNAWVVGDEPFVAFEFESKTIAEYAKD